MRYFKAIVSFIMVFAIVICSVQMSSEAYAVISEAEAEEVAVENIKVPNPYGILKGETLQLKAITEPEDALFSSVKWESDKPDVISCTKDGKIKGLKSNSFATITCTAKIGKASNSIKVYCVEPLESPVKSEISSFFTFFYKDPYGKSVSDIYFNINLLIKLINIFYKYAGASIVTAKYVTVKGRYGKYCLVDHEKTVETEDGEKKTIVNRGFFDYNKLSAKIPEFLYLSNKEICVFSDGTAEPDVRLTAEYNGEVTWKVGNSKLIDFNKNTGKITGKSPGTTWITAEADEMAATCVVRVLFKWPAPWETRVKENVDMYTTPNKETVCRRIYSDEKITVLGDCGNTGNMCYVRYTSFGRTEYGFVDISDISEKGTISYYNKLNWRWPIQDETIRYIQSPYGQRDTKPKKHRGIDITTGIKDEIKGESVVSAFKGKVVYINTDESLSCGYCVGIMIDNTYSTNGKNYVAMYMHLIDNPKKYVSYEQIVSAGTVIGKVGSSRNSGGYHLHFEVNNNAIKYGDPLYIEENMGFRYNINPIFFFMDYYNKNPNKINPTCEAMRYYGPYWYGNDD